MQEQIKFDYRVSYYKKKKKKFEFSLIKKKKDKNEKWQFLLYKVVAWLVSTQVIRFF